MTKHATSHTNDPGAESRATSRAEIALLFKKDVEVIDDLSGDSLLCPKSAMAPSPFVDLANPRP
jgi:hypothetical protein